MKVATLLFAILLCTGLKAQTPGGWSINVGGGLQSLISKRDNFPALAAIAAFSTQTGGNPDKEIPRTIISTVLNPKIQVNYRTHFANNIHLIAFAGTSMDFKNSFKLAGTIVVNQKTQPYPASWSAGFKVFKKQPNGLLFGGEFAFDNQKSDILVNNSNITPIAKGLLTQISQELNMLTSPVQFNGLFGWETNNRSFDVFAFLKPGFAGKVFALHGEVGLRYYFKKRPQSSFENFE